MIILILLNLLENTKPYTPRNKNIDYINFLIAMTFYEQVQVVAKDQTYTKAALKEFNSIIKKYPNSKYAKEFKIKNRFN